MESVQEGLSHNSPMSKSHSHSGVVKIDTSVDETDDGITIVKARARFLHNGEYVAAESSRSIELGSVDESCHEQIIAATKRDALRELVTRLQIRGVF